MSLVVRRAGAARSLLAAAGALALIATLLLTGLVAFSRQVVAAGAAGVVAAAPAESAVLVRGSAGKGAAGLRERDAAVRGRFAGGLGSRPVSVAGAGYAAGRELSGDTGDAVPDSGGVVYAAVAFLENLPAHAELTAGAWPEAGASPVRAAVGAGAARVLGLGVGDRVPVTDRVDGSVTELVVSGVWQPRVPTDPYWQLAPDVAAGVGAGSATYGPLVVDRADFDLRFITSASAAWLVRADLAGAGVPDVRRAADAAAAERTELAAATGLGSSAVVESRLGDLADRLARADLVGRSALVTPLLLVAVLSGLALVLIAALLTEHRRGESALLRARGATSAQLAGLSAGEAVAVVLPAVLVAPPLAAAAVRYAASRSWSGLTVATAAGWWPAPVLWLVAIAAGAGCAVAITVPALRGRTYVDDLVAGSRPNRRAAVQRAGADVVLIAVAVLGWLQLRQYSSPVAAGASGGLGIDPLLAAAPTLGILAGATLALRLLAPAARISERLLGRGHRFAPLFGMWQAGRRPHAGPVLLLALAVAASTVGWCLAATAERSGTDQADHDAGADLRLVETTGTAPAGRLATLTGLPGVTEVLPAWRESVQAGPDADPADLVAIDADAAGKGVHLRSDLYPGGAAALTAALTSARPAPALLELPAGGRLTGRIELAGSLGVPSLTAVFVDRDGADVPVRLERGLFSVELPARNGPLRLAGVLTGTDAGWWNEAVTITMSGLAVDGTPVPLDDRWTVAGRIEKAGDVRVADGVLEVTITPAGTGRVQFGVVRPVAPGPVPVVATARARDNLRLGAGRDTTLRIGGADVPVRLAGTIVAVPGSASDAAVLVDLPTLQARLLYGAGLTHGVQQWWLTVPAATHREAADRAAALRNLRVIDRRDAAAAAATDAYGVGGRTALFAAAIGALLLAAAGVLVDVRTTARRRIGELAVLHTLGAGPRMLARSMVTEQAFLAGVGVLAGLAVGVGVAATMAPLLILTPQASRPVPPPFLVVDWWRAGGTAALLLALALGLSALAGSTLRRRLATARLNLGADK
ncbi:FtsX-like permease family protein [Actinoplanes sp. NPDC051494]|uniref:FtsX-like permease family protein n=1 Tax=Actinoplanes sp. NPDC051494 TaxID=3363907 RepID=UPI0037B9E183